MPYRIEKPDEAAIGGTLRPTDPQTAELLRNAKTIAVVGLSSNHARPSYGVSKYMQANGYRIIPVNPNEAEVLGEKAYARLEDIPEKVDIVDIFRRPEHVSGIVDSAIHIGAAAVWMQEGVANSAAAQRAHDAGLYVTQNRCILKEHWRLIRGQ